MNTETRSAQATRLLKITQSMFFLNALVWLVFGILSFVRARAGDGNWRLTLAMLMVVNALLMFRFGLAIVKAQPWTFFLAILYVAANVVLSITDQFGWPDLLIMLLNLILLGLLIVSRQRLKQAKL